MGIFDYLGLHPEGATVEELFSNTNGINNNVEILDEMLCDLVKAKRLDKLGNVYLKIDAPP